MNEDLRTVSASRSARLLHAALTGGLALVGAIFVVLLRVLNGSWGGARIPAFAFAGIALVQIGFALTVWRRRIPPRRLEQSVEDYWSSNALRSSCIVLWALLEGAGLFALVGYLLTGGIVAAAIGLVALLALVGVPPRRLEGEGAA